MLTVNIWEKIPLRNIVCTKHYFIKYMSLCSMSAAQWSAALYTVHDVCDVV